MAQKNADGTVTLKTPGQIAQIPRGTGTGKFMTTAYHGDNGGGGGLVFTGTGRKGTNWRIVSVTER
jgi:hypothetical protein